MTFEKMGQNGVHQSQPGANLICEPRRPPDPITVAFKDHMIDTDSGRVEDTRLTSPRFNRHATSDAHSRHKCDASLKNRVFPQQDKFSRSACADAYHGCFP